MACSAQVPAAIFSLLFIVRQIFSVSGVLVLGAKKSLTNCHPWVKILGSMHWWLEARWDKENAVCVG
jgi:hypothetical protein